MTKEQKKQKIITRRHKFFYAATTGILRPIFKTFYHYEFSKPVSIPSPSIVLSNHATDYDPILVTACIKTQTYFLASENCFRKGFKSKFFTYAYGPISKIKGASDTLAVMKAIRFLKNGKNVCIFPEGGRTFNGTTCPVEIATGKLVKVSGASLVTVKLTGGYFTLPRWGFGRRKGKWGGKIVNIYTPEQLKNMTPQQITDLISSDLYINAYDDQDKNPMRYKGKNLAYGMECGVCVCPSCKTIGNIKTEGNSVFCTNCEIKTNLDEYGYFEKSFPMRHFGEWDTWQENFYQEYVANFTETDKPLVYDDNVNLRTVNADHETVPLGCGRFSLYKDRFTFEPVNADKIELPVSKIPDSSVFGRTNFIFTDTDGLHYELYSDRIINVRKYISIWKLLR